MDFNVDVLGVPIDVLARANKGSFFVPYLDNDYGFNWPVSI